MKKFRGIEKFIEKGSAIGADYTHRTRRTSPAPATESPAEPTPTNPAPSHFAALRRTSPKSTRQGAAHFAGEVGRGIYIPPRHGEVCARCLARCSPLRTSPAVHGEEQGSRTAGGRTEEDGREDSSRPGATDGRPADGQTNNPSWQFDRILKSVNLTDFAKVSI